MKRPYVLLLVALLAACGKSSNTRDKQTFAAAMKVICEAGTAPGIAEANPADRWQRIAQYIEANVKNREALDLYARVAEMPPIDSSAALEEAARRADLNGCALVDVSPVQGHVMVTPSNILVEAEIARVEEVEAMARAIVRNRTDSTITVSVTPDTPYSQIAPVVRAIDEAGGKPVLVAEKRRVPITMPRTAGTIRDPGTPPKLEMVMTISPDRAALASLSGLEGTVDEPALSVALDDPEAAARAVGKALEDIVARRWPSGTERFDEDRRLTVRSAPDVQSRVLVPLLAAARHASDGRELFPDVALAVGIE
jgi:hypothetical protein